MHSSFRLDEDNVGLAVESAIGGYRSLLKVSLLHDSVFAFHVSCKDVGFFVFHQKTFVSSKFHCVFNLWGNGGPDWKKEFKLWQVECDE